MENFNVKFALNPDSVTAGDGDICQNYILIGIKTLFEDAQAEEHSLNSMVSHI